MIRLKASPATAVAAGAELLQARWLGEELAEKAIAAVAAVNATRPDLVKAGGKEMELAEGLALLMEAGRAAYLVGMAHDKLRGVLARHGFSEPTNEDLKKLIAARPTPKGGGGGGGRGGGGR
jgi:hypothetical protein